MTAADSIAYSAGALLGFAAVTYAVMRRFGFTRVREVKA